MSEISPPALQVRNDFPDWLSPMLVKELRQGMRTKVFVFSFILLQVLMTLNVVIGLLSTSNGLDPGATNTVFWIMVGLPVLLILPMSGLGALSSEKAANTLELIFLTRLSAWRIVLGKWFAIVAQIALFACAVLPYVMLRYFMGGVNLSDDLIGLIFLLAGSAVLTAIAVGVSPFQTRIGRVVTIVAIVFMIFFGLSGLLALLFDGGVVRGGGSSSGAWPMVIALLLFGAMLVVLMLQIAAGRIAPAAENHSAIKRLAGVGFLAVAAITVAVGATPGRTIVLAMVCCIPVLVGAVCDPIRANHGVYRWFVRRGLSGRVLGRIFYPGWPAGVIYSLLLFGAFGILLAANKQLQTDHAQLIFAGAVGAVFFPAAIIRLCFPRTDNPLAFFSGTIAVCIILTIMGSILDGIFKSDLCVYLCALPPCAFIESVLSVINSGSSTATAVPIATVGSVLSILVLLVRMVPAWACMGAIEKEIAATTDEPVA